MIRLLALCTLLYSITSLAQQGNGSSAYKAYWVQANAPISTSTVSNKKDIGTAYKKLSLCPSVISMTITYQAESIGHIQPEPFIAYSASYNKENVKRISIRFSKDSIHWAPYITLTEDEHYEGDKTKACTQLYFADKGYAYYQVKATVLSKLMHTSTSYLKLNFFNPTGVSTTTSNASSIPYTTNTHITDATRQLNPTACPCPLPSYTTRTQWNCPQGQGLASGVVVNPAVTHLIVHHSAGSNTSTNWNAVVLSIWNFHIGTNGYSDIGYNWLIAPNGALYEGRGSNNITDHVQGAHFCGFNPATMGVCMIGTFTTVDITDTARSTLNSILAWKCCQANIPAVGTALHASSGLILNRISGHRDGCATDCPGTTFYGTIPTVRTAVASTINNCGAVVPCTPSFNITNTGCPSNTITFAPTSVVNGGTAPIYSWYVNNAFVQNGSSFLLNNATNTTKVYATMQSNAPCAGTTLATSDTVTISCIVTTAVTIIDGLQYCTISPNPTRDVYQVNIKLNTPKTIQYRLLNTQGNTLWMSSASKRIGTINQVIPAQQLAAGVYFIEVMFNNKSNLYKVVKL